MKVLEVTIENAELSEARAYQISYQGKVESDISEVSKTPKFHRNALYVPFAIVRDGKELLSVTLSSVNKETNESTILVRDTLLIHPGKDRKELKMDISNISNASEDSHAHERITSDIKGVINFSYKIVTLSIMDSIKGPNGSCGLAINSNFMNTAPQDLSVRVKDSNGVTVGTGKLTSMHSFAFIDIKKKTVLGEPLTMVITAVLSGTSLEVSLRKNCPNTAIVHLSPEKNAFGIITVLLQDGELQTGAIFHDCMSNIPFQHKGVFHVDMIDDFDNMTRDDNTENVEIDILKGIRMVYDEHHSPRGGQKQTLPILNGPQNGLYILPTGGVDIGIVSQNNKNEKPLLPDTESLSRRATKHRDSIFQKGGHNVIHIGMVGVAKDFNCFTNRMGLKVTALDLQSMHEQRNDLVFVDKPNNMDEDQHAIGGKIVATGILKEILREKQKDIMMISFAGEVKEFFSDNTGVLAALGSSKSYSVSCTCSIVSKDPNFLGPEKAIVDMLPTQKNDTESENGNSSSQSEVKSVTSNSGKNSKENLQNVPMQKINTDVVNMGVVEDEESKILPIVCSIKPRCNQGHEMELVTGLYSDLVVLNTSETHKNTINSNTVSKSVGKIEYIECDVCLKKHLETHVSYHHCFKCSYDLCHTCLPKRLNDNLMTQALDVTSKKLVDEIFQDAVTIYQDESTNIESNLIEDAVSIVTTQLIEYQIHATLNGTMKSYISNWYGIENDYIDVALEETEHKIVNELFKEICNDPILINDFNMKHRKKEVIDKAADNTQDLEAALDGTSTQIPYNEEYDLEGSYDNNELSHSYDSQMNSIVGIKKQKDKRDNKKGSTKKLIINLEEKTNMLQNQLLEQQALFETQLKEIKNKNYINNNTNASSSAIVNVIRMELIDKQKLIDQLYKDIKHRDHGLSVCEMDIRKLREMNLLLTNELGECKNILNKMTSECIESEKMVCDLFNIENNTDCNEKKNISKLNTSPLHSLTHKKLIKIISALYTKMNEINLEKNSIEQYINEAQSIRLKYKKTMEDHEKLQQVHMEQNKVLMTTQKEVSKLNKYKSTILMQEQVIAKLQNMMERQIQDQMINTVTVHDKKPSKLSGMPNRAIVSTESCDQNSNVNSNASLQSGNYPKSDWIEKVRYTEIQQENERQHDRILELEKQIQQYANNQEVSIPFSNPQSEMNHQIEETENIIKDIRIKSLEEQLQKTTQESSKEIARLRMLIFEFEMNANFDADDDIDVINAMQPMDLDVSALQNRTNGKDMLMRSNSGSLSYEKNNLVNKIQELNIQSVEGNLNKTDLDMGHSCISLERIASEYRTPSTVHEDSPVHIPTPPSDPNSSKMTRNSNSNSKNALKVSSKSNSLSNSLRNSKADLLTSSDTTNHTNSSPLSASGSAINVVREKQLSQSASKQSLKSNISD